MGKMNSFWDYLQQQQQQEQAADLELELARTREPAGDYKAQKAPQDHAVNDDESDSNCCCNLFNLCCCGRS